MVKLSHSSIGESVDKSYWFFDDKPKMKIAAKGPKKLKAETPNHKDVVQLPGSFEGMTVFFGHTEPQVLKDVERIKTVKHAFSHGTGNAHQGALFLKRLINKRETLSSSSTPGTTSSDSQTLR